jgi:hypothetical protein
MVENPRISLDVVAENAACLGQQLRIGSNSNQRCTLLLSHDHGLEHLSSMISAKAAPWLGGGAPPEMLSAPSPLLPSHASWQEPAAALSHFHGHEPLTGPFEVIGVPDLTSLAVQHADPFLTTELIK